MTARDKVLDIESQVRAIVGGRQDGVLWCPFCGLASTPVNEVLCCNEAAEVVTAVLDHIEFKQTVENVNRIMDRLASQQHGALVN